MTTVTTNSKDWLDGYYQALKDAAKMVEDKFDFVGDEFEVADAIRKMKSDGPMKKPQITQDDVKRLANDMINEMRMCPTK